MFFGVSPDTATRVLKRVVKPLFAISVVCLSQAISADITAVKSALSHTVGGFELSIDNESETCQLQTTHQIATSICMSLSVVETGLPGGSVNPIDNDCCCHVVVTVPNGSLRRLRLPAYTPLTSLGWATCGGCDSTMAMSAIAASFFRRSVNGMCLAMCLGLSQLKR